MPTNIQLLWIKRFYRANQKPWFGENVQDCKDGSGLQFIKFDFLTDSQEIGIAILLGFSL